MTCFYIEIKKIFLSGYSLSRVRLVAAEHLNDSVYTHLLIDCY